MKLEWKIPHDKMKTFWEYHNNLDKTSVGKYQFWNYVRSIMSPDLGFDWEQPMDIEGQILHPKITQEVKKESNST